MIMDYIVTPIESGIENIKRCSLILREGVHQKLRGKVIVVYETFRGKYIYKNMLVAKQKNEASSFITLTPKKLRSNNAFKFKNWYLFYTKEFPKRQKKYSKKLNFLISKRKFKIVQKQQERQIGSSCKKSYNRH